MNVLITGAAGAVGSTLRKGLAGRYALLRLADLAPLQPPGEREECLAFDVTDLAAATEACRGIDCVVHLAGIPVEPKEQAWEKLLPANVVGTYNMFEAARQAGVRRMIYASSNHVVGFYRREQVLSPDALPRPDSLYGVSKVFGEALGRFYADKYAMSVACLRIGSFREAPEDRRQLATWISPQDMVQLVARCIEAPAFHFITPYGVSDNEGSLWSNAGLEWLGYRPLSRAQATREQLESWPAEDPVARIFHGGSFCSQDFDGDPHKID